MSEATRSPAVIRADQRTAANGLPRGVLGEQAFHDEQAWVGFLRLEPGTSSPWHHHGAYDSYAYVFSGVLRWEHGLDGRDATEVHAGDVGRMPAWLVHRDVSAGADDLELVLFRAGRGGVLTIDVDGPNDVPTHEENPG